MAPTASWQHGTQNITFGYDGRLIIENEQSLGNPLGNFTFDSTLTNGPSPSAAVPAGQQQFDAFAAFLIGTPTTVSIQRQQTIALSQFYNAVFVQDDWRITPRFTPESWRALRYRDWFLRERYNRWADFDPTLANPLSSAALPVQGGALFLGQPGTPSRMWQTDYNKVEPRNRLCLHAVAQHRGARWFRHPLSAHFAAYLRRRYHRLFAKHAEHLYLQQHPHNHNSQSLSQWRRTACRTGPLAFR